MCDCADGIRAINLSCCFQQLSQKSDMDSIHHEYIERPCGPCLWSDSFVWVDSPATNSIAPHGRDSCWAVDDGGLSHRAKAGVMMATHIPLDT
mmetsp:Transcript_7448/g.15544  ORF Transcript_7448/g.15544 Transcript_7448/m.15544 type:complete len:93 (-) Transcript_7448:261-539(-)